MRQDMIAQNALFSSLILERDFMDGFFLNVSNSSIIDVGSIRVGSFGQIYFIFQRTVV